MSRAESNYAMVLAAEIARALEVGSPHQEIAELAGGIALADVITQDPLMLRILDLIRRVGDTSLTVLLQGETGTGKKLLAHAIHRASGRRNRPFVTVDCAALPETLLEAELFGYRKGAFTGAQQDRSGLLAEATGGTVFLDEIDKAGLGVQRRFLHLLDSAEIRPVGSTSYVRLDVRVVCATSCPDLRQEVAEGRFLKDLYYRLNDISIQIPSLRERREDILLLAGCFVDSLAAQAGRRIRGMSNAFRRRLLDHDWPGNVRELEKAIRRAITLADDDDLLSPDLLPREILEGAVDAPERAGDRLRHQVETFERRAIQHALEVCEGNKSRAAALLGLSRKGLKGKIARYRIGSQSPPGA
jgi:transcriptional regulator with PAS, ATPase and Fis domain